MILRIIELTGFATRKQHTATAKALKLCGRSLPLLFALALFVSEDRIRPSRRSCKTTGQPIGWPFACQVNGRAQMKPEPVIIISGIDSENLALDLTRALLLLQQQRRLRRPMWRQLEFRPLLLEGAQAGEFLASRRPVQLLEGSTDLVTGSSQAARETFPTLSRVEDKRGRRR